MKKIFVLYFCVLICLTGMAQIRAYQPWDSATATGPLNFMTLDVQNHPYIRLNYNESYSVGPDNFENSSATGPNIHHQLITTNGSDPCRCFNTTGSTYIHENYFPTTDVITKPNGAPVDTVIRLGSTTQNNNSQIEYWFYPKVSESTLLVCFSFAEEDVDYHDKDENPRFYIELLDGQTNQLIQSGYYPTEAATVAGNLTPTNNNWSYSRFLAVPSGENSNQDHSVWSDNLQSFVYYWAFPQATPTTFPYRECPSNQTSGQSSYTVKWFEYKPIAFNLSSYAAQHKSVKLRIRAKACVYFAHWNYALFYAKMIPSSIHVDACGSEPIHLSVPNGFLEDVYEWHYGFDSLDATTRPELQINITPGITGTVYDVMIDRDVLLSQPGGKLWPYYSCKMRSYTGVPFLYEAEIKSYFLEPNITFKQKFDNCDFRAQLIDSSRIFSVTPPGPGQTEDDTTFQQTHHIQWFVKNYQTSQPNNDRFDSIPNRYGDTSFTYVFNYPYIDTLTGEAFIKIVIQDSLQKCIKDTIKRIQLDLKAIRDTLTYDTIYTCEEKMPYVFDRAYFGENQIWNSEGTRRVTYNDTAWNGCDSIVDVTLIVRKPKVEITSDPDFCEAFSTNLTAECAETVLQYKWENGETSPSITIDEPGRYSVEIINKDSCSSTGSIVIPACKPYLNLPNSFSPSNQDGLNDYFYIPQRNLIKELEFTVFNRHGVMIYHTTNKEFEWNGTENGNLFMGATYNYILRIVDYEGVASVHKGSVTIF